MTAALTYEDTRLDHGEEGRIECWSLSRVMADYEQANKSVVEYTTLPTMRTG